MKKIFLISLLTITSVFAQQKIGHVHIQKIMDVMPDVVTAMEELTSDQSTVESTLTSLYEEYQNKMTEFQQNSETMNDVIKQSKIKEIQDLELTIQQYQQEEQVRLQQKEQEMLQQIFDKIQVAVDEVAKETECSYVLQSDGAVPTVLFDSGPNSFDITELVKKKLNL
tara:strand:+ start:34 stop:537 length:504 start_codon:yes stop_codon:yes gene_type:complete